MFEIIVFFKNSDEKTPKNVAVLVISFLEKF